MDAGHFEAGLVTPLDCLTGRHILQVLSHSPIAALPEQVQFYRLEACVCDDFKSLLEGQKE